MFLKDLVLTDETDDYDDKILDAEDKQQRAKANARALWDRGEKLDPFEEEEEDGLRLIWRGKTKKPPGEETNGA